MQLVYSHAHLDHTAGAGLLFTQVPKLPIVAEAGTASWDNKFGIFRTLLDGLVAQCATEVQGRWIDKLAGVDVFGASHCRAALIYARWDD